MCLHIDKNTFTPIPMFSKLSFFYHLFFGMIARARVARDESEDRRRKEEERAKRRAAELDVRIGKLRKRAIEAALEAAESDDDRCPLPVEPQEHAGDFLPLRSEAELKKKRYRSDTRSSDSKRLCTKGVYSSDSGTRNKESHINFFENEEKLFKKAGDDHAKYLSVIGHTTSVTSLYHFHVSYQNAFLKNFICFFYIFPCVIKGHFRYQSTNIANISAMVHTAQKAFFRGRGK